MACLIENLDEHDGTGVWEKLESAARAVAKAYLARCRAVPCSTQDLPDLFRAVNESGLPVDLSAAHDECRLVHSGSMDAVEVFNNLRHVEVLVGVRPVLDRLGLVPTQSAATQNSGDDLSGTNFVVEAFGGVNIENNGKGAKALDLLQKSKVDDQVLRVFFAARRSAFVKDAEKWKKGCHPCLRHRQKNVKSQKNDSWSICAQVAERYEEGEYVLLELVDFKKEFAVGVE